MCHAELFDELKRFLTDRGAAIVVCADLQVLPGDIRRDLPRGVSIGAALDAAVIAGIADGPTREYVAEYCRANALLHELGQCCATFLVGRGYRAVPGEPTVDALDRDVLATPLPHKTVATRAGAGWVGRCALLITDDYGSAVRYNTVLTDAPLPPGTPVEVPRCGDCTACVDACPGGAPSGRNWRPGVDRTYYYDAFTCYRTAREQARKLGVDVHNVVCGICIAACPHTRRYLKREGAPLQ